MIYFHELSKIKTKKVKIKNFKNVSINGYIVAILSRNEIKNVDRL